MTQFETTRGTVHAWQCDHMGHANLRAYGEFFEQALWHVFQRIGITPSVLRGDAIRMAGVEQNIRYRKELLPGDLIFVRSSLVELRERALKMAHEMVHVESGEVCAVCELTAVCLDARTRRAREFPPDVAARAKQLLKGEPHEPS
jgi:acyl-CoA thioester hydrolase